MKQFKNVSKRLIALLVSVLMLISMIPVSTLIAFAMDSFDVTIKLVEGSNPITGASITYTIGEDATTYDAVEESDGVYHLDDASAAMSTAQDNTIDISYTVTANGYDSVTDTATVDADNMAINVEMTKALLDANLKVENAVAAYYLKKYGDNVININATTDSSSAIVYESNNLSVAKVDTTGKIEVLTAGEAKITVSVVSDGVYKEDKVEYLLTVKEDTTAPAAPSIKFSVTPDEYVVSNNTITVELESTDAQTGIYKYYYKLNDSNDFVEVSGNSFTMAPQYRGTVLVKAVDNAGNESSVADADGKIVILDSQAPDIESKYTLETDESITSGNKVFTNGDITVDFTVTDTNVDISGEPVVKVNGADKALSAWDQANGKGSFLLSDEGEYTYSITYTDIANNSKTIVSDTVLVIDKTAPVISTVDGNATEWTNDDVTLKVNASDAACGGVTYSLNGGEYKSASEFTVTANGEYSFKVKDALGNESEATVVTVNKIDKDVPEIKNFVADKSSWTNDKVTITGKVEDAASGVEKLYYQKNGDTSWSVLDFNPNFTLVVDEECNTTYKFYCEDAAGNKSTVSSVDVKIDRTAPVNAINAISGWKKENIAITGDVTEEDSGLSKVYYRLTGATDWSEAAVTGTSFNFNTALTTSGTYTYDVYSVDEAGNESVISVTSAISFDNVKPTVALNALDPEGWTNGNITVSGSVSDDLSDIKNIYYVRANGTPVELENNNGTFSFVIPNDANNTDSYVVYCVDNAGNTSVNSEFAAQIDTVKPSKPTITYSTPAIQQVLQTLTFGIYKAEQVATIEATDDLSGVKEIEYKLGSTTEKKVAVDGKITVTIPVGTNAELTAIAYDNAGNNSEQQDISKDSDNYEFYNVAVDAVKPEITDVSATPSDWTNQKVVISGTVSDDNVGVEKIFIKKGAEGQYEEVTNFDGTNFSYEISAQDYNGDYILYCVDYAGHISDEKPITVKMDITNPEVLNVVANPDVMTNGNVVIGGNVSDNLSGVKTVYYRQGQGETKTATLTDNTYEFVIPAQDYIGNFYVWCEDKAGNVSDESFIVVNMDATKPVVDSGVAVSADWTNDNVVISGSVSDPTVNGVSSGVVTVTYTGTDGSAKNATLNADGSYEFTLPKTNYVGDIDIFCADKAGNKSDVYSVAVKMDIDAPAVETGTAVSADWTKEDVVISGVVSDTSSGVNTVYYRDTKGNEKTATLDGNNYTFTLEKTNYEGNIVIYCVDNAGNRSADYIVGIKMDVEAPTKPIITYDRNALEYVLEVITFGFYDADITATITATDNLSLDTIEYEYVGTKAQFDSTSVTKTENLAVAGDLNSGKITVTIPAEFKGTLKARAWDKAGNISDWADEVSDGRENIKGVVIDTFAPNVDKDINDYVEYSPEEIRNKHTMDEVDSFVYGDNVILFYQKEALVTINIDESNFYSEDVIVAVTKNGEAHNVDVEWTNKQDNKFVGTFTLVGDGDYSFTVNYTDRSENVMTEYKSPEIRIDNTKPVVEKVEYTPEEANANGKYFNTERKARIFVREHNFLADDVVASITAKDVTGANVAGYTYANLDDEDAANDYVKEFSEYLAERDNWYYVAADGSLTKDVTLAADPDIHVAEVTFTTDAHYTFALDCNDIIGNSAEQYNAPAFVIDHVEPNNLPNNLTISYEDEINVWQEILSTITFGYYSYNPSVVVTITADDITSGVDYFEWKYTREANVSTKLNVETENGKITAKSAEQGIKLNEITYSPDGKTAKTSFKLTADQAKQYRGSIWFTATDRAGNTSEPLNDANRINIVDTIAPNADKDINDYVHYVPEKVYDKNTMNRVNDFDYGDDVILYYEKEALITINIDEANFYSEDVVVSVTKNGANYPVSINWVDNSEDEHVGTFTIVGDGDYSFTVNYPDRSNNVMTEYVSPEIRIDDTDPVIQSVVYTPADANANGKYFNTDRKATVTIKEHNFLADYVVATVTAKDVTTNSIGNEKQVADYFKNYLSDRDNWYYVAADGSLTKDVTLAADPDIHVAEVTFTTDAHYTFALDCNDIIGNSAEQYNAPAFVIDHEKPTNLSISYSEPTVPLWKDILNVITFGAYNPKEEVNAPLIVKISADDITSGVDYFDWKYTKEAGASNINATELSGTIKSDKITYSPDGLTATATFEIPAQARGYVSFRAIDRAGNGKEDADWVHDDKRINIVDTIDPIRTVSYTPASQVVDATTLIEVSEYVEGDNVIAYYNTDNIVKITVNEANFYSNDVEVVVTKNGAIYPVTVDWTDSNVDVHVGTFTLAAPEDHSGDGDYIVNIKYTDRSNNVMKEYTSHLIVIDTIHPEIAVGYETSTEVVLKDTDGNDREYFNDVRKATITIKEHNFCADDVVISVKAKNVLGNDIDVGTLKVNKDGNVESYLVDGATRSKWTAYDVNTVRRADDTYEMEIVYAEDANYTFDIDYTDLATNEDNGYASDYFTVDKTKPECVEVKYSETVDGKTIVEKILNTITFGAIYYNEQMEVTITAKDDISGINHFVYSYEINDDVSKVNAELLNQTIAEALENSPIVRDENSSNFTATFNIPKEALTNVNQFNGTVHFTAYDRSTNESDQFSGESTIVVDNIKPTSTVTFNDPVQKVDNVSYYDGEINATIVINEANFFSDDVKVVVTKDDANFPVQVDWKDNSVDVHTGTFTLAAPENHSGDGDYIVNVTYVDRSTNEMTPFVSNQLTIDTKDPVINVSNVKHQSANNEETISFTVSVTDTNIALESFKPTLNAVIKKDNGNNSFTYETMAIALGNATTTTNANGETVYTYSINNLEVDGFYSLVCSAVDYANHSVSIINSAADEGGNTTVETMNFSVNREGSVFWIETEHNDKYTGETFTDKLNGAYANDKVTIKLHEINVDKVDENADKKTVFTLNDGSESEDIVLEEDKNYSKNVIVGTGGWYETVYTLDNDNFDHDGVYSLNVITYDKADNSNVNTKTEAGTISFTLDRTNPVISANIKNDQSVNDTQFWVEFEITETNLDAETIVVKLTNNDGKTVETEVEDLGNNEYKFLVESGYNYSVEIVAKDLAGNESELYKVEHLTVSTNIFILWYANTPLFWGSIGGTVLLAGIIILLIFLKKRKKNEEK